MTNSTLLPLVSKAVGRDVTVDINLFYRARAAIGKALNEEEQLFFVQNWPKIVDFMESKEGQVAITMFLSDWYTSLQSKTTTNESSKTDI